MAAHAMAPTPGGGSGIATDAAGLAEEATTAGAPADAPPPPAVVVNSLTFAYPGTTTGQPSPVISGMSLSLPAGATCLLVGANGAGKSTLLQLLAGHCMVPLEAIRVLGRPAFHDTSLTSSGALAYLGSAWRKDVACAGYGVPCAADLPAGELIEGVPGVDPARKAKLVALLGIDPDWRLPRLSDGQRRRVQICMGLLKPYSVLLLDEVTVDMDVLARLDLLAFLSEEAVTRGAVIIYATHIFDGLAGWATHVARVSGGKLVAGGRVDEVAPELAGGGGGGGGEKKKLWPVVEGWLRSEREEACAVSAAAPAVAAPAPTARRSEPAFPSKHMAFFR